MRRRNRQGKGVGGDRPRTVHIRNRWRQSHPLEFRERVVREVIDEKVSIAEVARVFGIATTTISHWVQRYREDGVEGLIPGQRGPRPGAKPGEPTADGRGATPACHPVDRGLGNTVSQYSFYLIKTLLNGVLIHPLASLEN